MNEDVDRIPEIALDWVREGRTVALATVIQTWGSAPRPIGSQLVISDEAAMMGSVSGGCVEGAVVEEALDSFADGTPRLLTYGVTDDEAFAVGLVACGTVGVVDTLAPGHEFLCRRDGYFGVVNGCIRLFL